MPDVDSVLVDALNRELQPGQPANTTALAGLPARHASFQIYPVAWGRVLTVPLDTLSGRIDILGKVESVGAPIVTTSVVRDHIDLNTPHSGTYDATFTLPAGSYVCHLIVRVQSTGQIYGESIHFEAR